MPSFSDNGKGRKVMLGFVVRRCAKELGHRPTPDEFALWANNQRRDGERYHIFGDRPSRRRPRRSCCAALDRLVTVRSPEVILGQREAS